MPKFAEPADEEVQREWLEFWAPILIPYFEEEGLAGEVDIEQVKRELFDYHALMRNASSVYEAISGLCKPNTAPMHIIQAHEEECSRARDEGWDECKEFYGIGPDEDWIQTCTLEQPHEGSCNGWPCAYVRSLPCPRRCGMIIGDCLEAGGCGEEG